MIRPRRSLAQIVVAVVVIAALGVGAWLALTAPRGPADCCIPCRERAPVRALVPPDVDFVFTTSFPKLVGAAWIQSHVVGRPLIPGLEEFLEEVRAASTMLASEFERHREQLLPSLEAFSIERDLLRGEVVVAGRLCEGDDPEAGPPTAREILLLTRISPQLADALAKLKMDEIGESLAPWKVEDRGEGVFRFTDGSARPSSLAERTRCGPAHIIPPENVWYGLRVGDVLAWSNAELLVKDVARLATEQAAGSAPPTPSTPPPPMGSLAVEVQLRPLHGYLLRWLELAGPPATLSTHFVTLPALMDLQGRIDCLDPAGLKADFEVRYDEAKLGLGVAASYALEPDSLVAAASVPPADDTFALLTVRSPPDRVVSTLFHDLFSAGDRKLWRDNLRRTDSLEAFAEHLDASVALLGDTWSLALARRSDIYDHVDHEGFFDPEPVMESPLPAAALFVKLPKGTDVKALEEHLSYLTTAIDASARTVAYRGLALNLGLSQAEHRYFGWPPLSWVVTEQHLIVANHTPYLQEIVDTLLDPSASPPLSTDATWRETAAHLPDQVHLGLFVDVGKLVAVPPDLAIGGQPRGYLWDRRSEWVLEHRAPRDEAIRYRKELLLEHTQATGEPADERAREAIEAHVNLRFDAWIARYPEFEETYRQQLAAYKRLRGLGITVEVKSPTLHVDLWLGSTDAE